MKIVVCPPELRVLHRVVNGEIADATFIIQKYIYHGLQNRGYKLSFLGPYYPEAVIFTDDLDAPTPARRTWSKNPLFEIAGKLVWRIQHLLGMPYLNVFSNLRLLDACLQHLPGHDVVYERNTLFRLGIAMACKRLKIPYVLYFEADDILEHDMMKKPITGLLRWQANKAIRYNLNAADRVICVSEPLKAHLMNQWDVPEEKIVVFPNVADVNNFRPDPKARIEIRNSLGIGEKPLLIFLGNFYVWHDVSTLLRAFARVLDSYPDTRLILVGDGEHRKEMMQYSIDLNIGRSVTFTGMVAHTEVPHYLAAADIAVVPYPALKQDIWLSPLKLFEYMATGNAVVASNVGQLSDWVSDDRNALLVPPGDVPAMATAIERLIADSSLRMRLGQNARDEVVRKHSWEHYLERLDQLLVCLVDKDRASSV